MGKKGVERKVLGVAWATRPSDLLPDNLQGTQGINDLDYPYVRNKHRYRTHSFKDLADVLPSGT